MRAATPDEISSLVDTIGTRIDATAEVSLLEGFPTAAIPRLADCSATPSEISRISSSYLDDRRRASRNIVALDRLLPQKITLVVLPVPRLMALTYHARSQHSILLTSGFLELLRFEAAAAIVCSILGKIEKLAKQSELKEIAGHNISEFLNNGRSMIAFWHGSSLMNFINLENLPKFEHQLSPEIQRTVSILLEPCYLFVLLHECGHIKYRSQAKPPPPSAAINLEFPVGETMYSSKREEIYADNFALQSVAQEFRLPLIHGALLLFNIHSYFEWITQARPEKHPLSINRVAALYQTAGSALTRDELPSEAAIIQAIQFGAKVWNDRDPAPVSRKLEQIKCLTIEAKANWLSEEFFRALNDVAPQLKQEFLARHGDVTVASENLSEHTKKKIEE